MQEEKLPEEIRWELYHLAGLISAVIRNVVACEDIIDTQGRVAYALQSAKDVQAGLSQCSLSVCRDKDVVEPVNNVIETLRGVAKALSEQNDCSIPGELVREVVVKLVEALQEAQSLLFYL